MYTNKCNVSQHTFKEVPKEYTAHSLGLGLKHFVDARNYMSKILRVWPFVFKYLVITWNQCLGISESWGWAACWNHKPLQKIASSESTLQVVLWKIPRTANNTLTLFWTSMDLRQMFRWKLTYLWSEVVGNVFIADTFSPFIPWAWEFSETELWLALGSTHYKFPNRNGHHI